MSKLSYMEKLLDGVEVEWRALRDVVKTITAPAKLKRESYREAGQTPIIDQGEKFITGYTDEDVKALPLGEYVIFGDHSEHIKYVDFSFIQGADGLKILKSISDNPKYVYYSFLNFYQKELNYKRHWARASETLIPIPCPDNPEKSLAIQSEIVQILDKFTALTAELTAELNMRKKQYNYYRDKLLSFDEGEVEYLPMGDERVGEFIRGGTFQKKDFTDFGVGCIHYGQIYTYYGTYTNTTKTFISESLARKCRKAESGNLIIATTSENDDDVCKAVAWLGYDDIAVSGDACIYKHKLNPKYVSYFFQTECFQRQKKQYITGAKVRRVNASNLAQILIPVPSPEEQARIVAILDKFELLTNSITEGLPREIELRQKQYEYYRDLLLSFPKSDEAA
ncbi:restriction endonuclease subunit S [Providencia rettgeri]|uniref:Type I restriction enzyme specificity protein MPN_089 n=1 Tax=Providencia rettgeri TaxID=587 RepID=A0A9N8D4L0_PRORE|nr:restriction endonuclease subunit S [Providencia rettgeri]CAB5670248.1 Type I restriction enzyme specificity protein MPN_089 [Providencia rettgeri]CAB5699989.1 Type I restriction enzyme specificity protein MPN_089 [Providencia rettgeri]CAC9237548.1 Type I restriction enzyme specificity protein MPN_089 [Providencia rettgeri]CAC9253147.1 Type I restriction enzyme specificity protein MPN_089 [Providencia rettgeri]